jgi:cell shape-determining protein MreC
VSAEKTIEFLSEYIALGNEIEEKRKQLQKMADELLPRLLERTKNMSLENLLKVYDSIPFDSDLKYQFWIERVKPARERK